MSTEIEKIIQAYNLALLWPILDKHLESLYVQDPFPYLRFLYYVGKLFNIKTAVELGTCTGRGTAHLAAACNWVFTIDPELHGAFIDNTKPYSNISFIQDRSDADWVLNEFDSGEVDLCFVDSVHTADYARKEIELWLPKMAKNGLFLLDDLDLMPGLLDSLPFENKGYLDNLHIKGFGYAFI